MTKQEAQHIVNTFDGNMIGIKYSKRHNGWSYTGVFYKEDGEWISDVGDDIESIINNPTNTIDYVGNV